MSLEQVSKDGRIHIMLKKNVMLCLRKVSSYDDS